MGILLLVATPLASEHGIRASKCIVIALFRPGQPNFVHYRIVSLPGFWLWSSRLAKMAREQGIPACSFREQGTNTRHMADHVNALLLEIQTFRVFTIPPSLAPQ